MFDWTVIIIIAVAGIVIAGVMRYSRSRRISDDRLTVYRAFLEQHAERSLNSKAFEKAAIATKAHKMAKNRMFVPVTTERLNGEEYEEIKKECFTPALESEYGEWDTWIKNVFSARAVQLTQIFRKQQASEDLSSEEREILIREGLGNPEAVIVILPGLNELKALTEFPSDTQKENRSAYD